MRLLPCTNPGCKGTASLSGGEPYYTSQWPCSETTFTYTCIKCKRRLHLSLGEYQRLPDLTVRQLHEDHGVCNWGILQDIHNLAGEHVAQLFQAGFTAAEIAALPGPAKSPVLPFRK